MNVTIKDIAKIANVSYATVSRALSGHSEVSEKTRTKVKNIAQELGYKPNALARGLVTKSSKTFGFVLPDITNPFFPDIAQGIDDCANANDYQLFLCNSNWEFEREKKQLEALCRNRVDGIIIHSVAEDLSVIHDIIPSDIPIVFCGMKPQAENSNYVMLDDYNAGALAAEYIIGLGHRRISFVAGDYEGDDLRSSRQQGCFDTIKKSGNHIPDDYIKIGSWKQKSGYNLMTELLSENQAPTAVIAGNDIIALGVIQAIEEFGLNVPEDISVIGFDDIIYSSLYKINLTTIYQPKYRIGELCVEVLLELIKNPNKNIHKILQPKVIERLTCRPYKES